MKQRTAVRRCSGIFVTGTDTDVGKTLVTAALATRLTGRRYSIGVMKPVETGIGRPAVSDAARLRRAAGTRDMLDLIRPYAFRQPVAPLDAARLSRKSISLSVITRAVRSLRSRHDLLLIEGVGGVHVPLTRTVDVLDLISQLKVPTVVVGRASLGGVNHALLTVKVLRQRRIPIVALVLNRTSSPRTILAQRQERSTTRLLHELAGVPVIGPLPYHSALSRRFDDEVVRLARTAPITKLMRLVLASGRGRTSRRGQHPAP